MGEHAHCWVRPGIESQTGFLKAAKRFAVLKQTGATNDQKNVKNRRAFVSLPILRDTSPIEADAEDQLRPGLVRTEVVLVSQPRSARRQSLASGL
jgi:hypothetical protein